MDATLKNVERDVTGHLRGQVVHQANLVIGVPLQGTPAAHLAVRVGVATDVVQRIAVRQLRQSQGGELCRIGMQFELGGDDLFHERKYTKVSRSCQYEEIE